MLVHNIDTTLGSCHGFILDLNSRVNPNLKPNFNCKLQSHKADLSTSVRVKLKLGAQVDLTIAIYR